jgi:hypothetical protein
MINFPNSLEAADGKHIRMCTPDDSGSLFLISSNFFSMVDMALVDAATASLAQMEKPIVHLTTATSLIFKIYKINKSLQYSTFKAVA